MGGQGMKFVALGGLALMACSGEIQTKPTDAWKDSVQTTMGIVRIDTRDQEVDDAGWDREWVTVDLELIYGGEDSPVTLESTPDWSGVGAIHIRGNSSMEYEKKQYALETRDTDGKDIDIAPFGLPAEEDWVLAAPYSDKTLMRNHLMFQWARAIGRYAPRTYFVELFMEDGGETLDSSDYRGVYVFTEKIKRDKNRVDVAKMSEDDVAGSDVTGGYLLKRDWVEGNVLTTEVYDDELVLKYPKEDKVTDAQMDYLTGYLSDFERALQRKDGSHAEYADLASFADHMMMMELSRNVDAYVLSTYMHKDRDGLLTMGPIWDFNGSLGNADYFESWESEGWHYENSEFPGDNPNGFHWYAELLKDADYQALLSQRWTEHRAGPWSDEKLMADIDTTVALLQEAQERNFERWPVLGDQIWPNDEEAHTRKTYEAEIEYLKTWLNARIQWLDSQWLK